MKYRGLSVLLMLTVTFLGINLGGCQSVNRKSKVLSSILDLKLELLVKDSSIRDYYAIEKDRIYLFAGPEEKKADKPEIVLYQDEFETFRKLMGSYPADSLLSLMLAKGSDKWQDNSLNSDITPYPPLPAFYYGIGTAKPLSGLKVAIDPGHIAGDFETAEIEGKYMKMNPSPVNSMQPIRFFEANLTLATAHLVRHELENLGAEVFMSRTEPGHGALGLTFEEWKTARWDSLMQEEKKIGNLTDEEIRKWKSRAEDKDIMSRFFTPEDLRERARVINQFRPHLTLIIHFNIDALNWEFRDENGFFQPTGQNYLMAFVPGSFMAGELTEPEYRLDFLRLLVSDDLDKSINLSKAFVNQSTRYTGVPIVSRDYPLGYLYNASIYTGFPGIYARNLSLTRMISSPVCYGESLCQDNIVESRAFNNKDFEIEGIPVSKRVINIARAYIKAVDDYAQTEFPQKTGK